MVDAKTVSASGVSGTSRSHTRKTQTNDRASRSLAGSGHDDVLVQLSSRQLNSRTGIRIRILPHEHSLLLFSVMALRTAPKNKIVSTREPNTTIAAEQSSDAVFPLMTAASLATNLPVLSGDRHIHSERVTGNVKVLTPRQFLEALPLR